MVIYSYDERIRRFIRDRHNVLKEIVLNCENLISTVSTFETACGMANETVAEANLCRGVWRLRSDVHACMERIAVERELISSISVASIITGLRDTDPMRFSFYESLTGSVTKPDICDTSAPSVCVDWGSILCIDLLTTLVFGLLPFGTHAGSGWSLLVAIVSFGFLRSINGWFMRGLHSTLRRLRISRMVSLLFPLQWFAECELLHLAMSGAILISSFAVVGRESQRTVMIRAMVGIACTSLWKILYYISMIYTILIVAMCMSNISNDIRTKLAFEELNELNEDVVRLWSEGSVTDLDRMSDAALIEFLLRVDLERLRPSKEQLFQLLLKRPCLKILVDKRENLKELYDGELQKVSERLCLIYNKQHNSYMQVGLLVGGISVIGYGMYELHDRF